MLFNNFTVKSSKIAKESSNGSWQLEIHKSYLILWNKEEENTLSIAVIYKQHFFFILISLIQQLIRILNNDFKCQILSSNIAFKLYAAKI